MERGSIVELYYFNGWALGPYDRTVDLMAKGYCFD